MFDDRILDIIEKFHKRFMTKKVLKTTEEVEANTNETNLVAAPVVSELINNLKGFTPVLDSTGKIIGYKTDIGGADTVFPFSGSYEIVLHISVSLCERSINTIKYTSEATWTLTITDGKIKYSGNNVANTPLGVYVDGGSTTAIALTSVSVVSIKKI